MYTRLLQLQLLLRWMLPFLAVVMLTTVFLLSSQDLRQPLLPAVAPSYPRPDEIGFLIHTSGCRIPLMKAFDPAIKKYINKVEQVECSKYGPLILSNQTSIWIDSGVASAKNIDMDELQCCYQPMWRVVMKDYDPNVRADRNIVYDKNCRNFSDAVNVEEEFIRVICHVNDTEVYKDFHSFIVPKPNKTDGRLSKSGQDEKISVLVIGIDAVSRLNFYRQLPKTAKFLSKMKAVELLGYNKVDDNTFPNLVPVLTGNTVEEIKHSCWKDDSIVFDDCNFIWKNFSERGYSTAFGEDASWMGIFQYVKKGFFRQPVDYYLHTFMSQSESEIAHTKRMNAEWCIGPRFAAQVLLDYAEKFSINMTESKEPFFGLFWEASLTHDYLNVLPKTDDLFEALLLNLMKKNVLNNTIVIVMSDHGIRWGPIRETYQGRVEERLPLVFFLMPDWFKEKYQKAMSNLIRNRRMLTSPFDIYETLVDLTDVRSLSPKRLEERQISLGKPRGVSLFLSVPESRTCEETGITDNWCTCHQSQNISVNNTIVGRAAQNIVDFLNQKLFQYIQCSQLILNEIKSAQIESPRKEVKENSKRAMRDITALIVTTPGLGEFEATVRHDLQDDTLSVLGYVSRINTYGSQSRCVADFHMKLYCYCS